MTTQQTIAELDQDMAYVIECIRKRHLTNGGGGAKYHKRMAARLALARKRLAGLKRYESERSD